MSADQQSSPFAATRWTLVLRAKGRNPEARAALGELCEVCYEPVRRFLRGQNYDEDTARELTQEFFARILAGGGFDSAQPGRGKFRSFVLGAVKHFLSDRRDRDRAAKRGGGQAMASLDDADNGAPVGIPPSVPAPDSFFDRQWGLALMQRALTTLEQTFAEAGSPRQFIVLKPWLAGDGDTLDQTAAARDLGISEGAVKVAIHRLRRQFRELIRDQIVQTLDDPADADEELRYLVEVLSSRTSP